MSNISFINCFKFRFNHCRLQHDTVLHDVTLQMYAAAVEAEEPKNRFILIDRRV